MNDFTKEELEEIIESFNWIESETSWDWKHKLRNKIKSMIDNYCEHTWFFYLNSKANSALRCHKCDKEINGDSHK
jgi:hypothetical protein